MKPILEIRGIAKKYNIRHENHAHYDSLRDSIVNTLKDFSNFNFKSTSKEEFYALKDVSFDVYAGDSLAIIGKNGAGKSTLLKILSQITPPSSGKIVSRGKIASLLEVGTGFHQELSGRENIYLNGSILGLKRMEINKHFDDIVQFSGVEQFIDTPIKHYSSGMQLRLAFAVAAHLEPEILIIDEVLAVGDAEFQKKCISKMNEVSSQGRTLLFVSHNLGIIRQLCNKGILLNAGKVTYNGTIEETCLQYLNTLQTQQIIDFQSIKRSGNGMVRFVEVTMLDNDGKPTGVVQANDQVTLSLKLKISPEVHNKDIIDVGFSIHDEYENTLTVCYSSYFGKRFFKTEANEAGELIGNFSFSKFNFTAKHLTFKGRITINGQEADAPINSILNLEVHESYLYSDLIIPHTLGSVAVNGYWK